MKSAAVLALAALALTSHGVLAQQPNTDFKVTGIKPDFVTTPDYSVNFGPKNKRVAKNKNFLEIETNFDWQPKANKPEFLDELTFTYYVLLKNQDRENPKGTLLVGSVTHTAIPQEKGLNSVMYVSPRTLERFFAGKVPTTVDQSVVDLAVTISSQGQLVAEASWKGRGQWWTTYQQVTGYVLNKNETPFGPLAWDYYEAIKARPAGQ
ncbi:MAG: Amuc_1102 family pilus-like protein [Chthoniobacterales bacterium]|jgi:hypothetical protein